MIDFKSMMRPCLGGVTPYFPGKPIAEVQRELGLKRVVKLASNENHLGASPRALAVLRSSAKDTRLYPEGASPLLRRAFAEHHGVEPGQVIVGNGSDEIIRLLCEAFLGPEDGVVVSQYAFIRFKQQAALMGASVVDVPMTDWTHDLQTMGRTASTRTKIVFVASPNNPTGTYNTRDEVAELLRTIPPTTLLVLDEAYCHYAAAKGDYPSSLPELVRKFPNLVVLRTFSKAYGLAGLRVGIGVGDEELIALLDRIRMPFNVNLPAQRAATEALKDRTFLKRSVAGVEKNRERLAADLRSLGLHAVDSAANFLFVPSPVPGHILFRRLLHLGVIIRALDEYGLPGHVRISVGSEGENRFLIDCLRKALEREGSPV